MMCEWNYSVSLGFIVLLRADEILEFATRTNEGFGGQVIYHRRALNHGASTLAECVTPATN